MRFQLIRNMTRGLVGVGLTVTLMSACEDQPSTPQVKKPSVTVAPAIPSAPALPTAPVPAPEPSQAARGRDAGVGVGVASTVVKVDAPPDQLIPVPVVTAPAPKAALPPDFAGRMKVGRKLVREGKTAEAIAAYRAASEIEPANAVPHLELARALIEAKRLELAKTEVDLALKLAPESSPAWNTRGRIALIEHRTVEAVEAFKHATEANPENQWAWNNLGLAYLELDQNDDAVAAFEAAVADPRPEAYMFNNLGVAYEHQNRLVEARVAYKRAAERGLAAAEQNVQRLDDAQSAKDGTSKLPPQE